MRSEEALLGRLDGLHLAHAAIPGDKEIECRIGELTWALENDPA